MKTRLRLAWLLAAAAVVGGCETREPAPMAAPPIDVSAVVHRHEQGRQRTHRRFARASFLSPQPDADAGIPLWMCPLLVHEYAPDPAAQSPWARFGALTLDSTGLATVDCDRPTVYLSAAEVMVGTQSLEQFTFWWFYPPAMPGQPIGWRGFRMTLGQGGYAVVWELLAGDSQAGTSCAPNPAGARPGTNSCDRTFYVSKPVEQAAAEQFGKPLSGRRFVVEPSVEEYPEVVVSRIVGDGPQPMGPLVYLDAPSASVITLICRCEPSQADAFPHSSHYDLQRIDAPQDLYGPGSPPPNLRLPSAHASPEGWLRLPDRL